MTRRDTIDPILPSKASQQEAQKWHHPGGKLVELGSQSLKQGELLAILIGSGNKDRPALEIANSVLDEYVGLHGIHRRATLRDLTQIPGLGPQKATRILAAIEIGRRLHSKTKLQKTSKKSEDGLFPSLSSLPETQVEPRGPSDASLIATIIGSGIRGHPPKVIAEELLAQSGSLPGLFGKDMGDFLSIKGLNSVKIIRIVAALEIAKRLDHALS